MSAECAFEACPGQYYFVEMAACDDLHTNFDLYSYSDLHALATGDCDHSVYIMGMDTCQLVSVYQYCYGGSCTGNASVTARPLPVSTLSWAADSPSPGQPLVYSLEGLGLPVDPFFDDAFVALFRSDMLSRTMHCDYFSSHEKDIYSYLFFELVSADHIAQGLTNRSTTSMFQRSPFGGSYKMVLFYYYEYAGLGMRGVRMAGQSEELQLTGGAVDFAVDTEALEVGAPISANWSSPHPASDNDYIALYEIDSEGDNNLLLSTRCSPAHVTCC
jgi:hypothetical protein